jgi:hypothetical protein
MDFARITTLDQGPGISHRNLTASRRVSPSAQLRADSGRREFNVSSAAPFDAKEQVRQATDIVELVGQYVRLHRKGQIYVGLCPWHDDSNPS